MSVKYDTSRFVSDSKSDLARIILTGDTQERWEKETPVFGDSLIKHLNITEDSVVLDFGVGIGRLAKAVIEKTNCTVIGVDISLDMLRESINYVSHKHYIPMPISAFRKMQQMNKLKIDCAYSVWVLQHCLDFDDVYHLIRDALPDKGPFFVANTNRRWIPIEGPEHWANDGVNIKERISEDFKLKHDLTAEIAECLPEGYDTQFFCHSLEKKA